MLTSASQTECACLFRNLRDPNLLLLRMCNRTDSRSPGRVFFFFFFFLLFLLQVILQVLQAPLLLLQALSVLLRVLLQVPLESALSEAKDEIRKIKVHNVRRERFLSLNLIVSPQRRERSPSKRPRHERKATRPQGILGLARSGFFLQRRTY